MRTLQQIEQPLHIRLTKAQAQLWEQRTTAARNLRYAVLHKAQKRADRAATHWGVRVLVQICTRDGIVLDAADSGTPETK